MSKSSKIIIVLIAIMVIVGFIGYKMWNKPFTDPLSGDAIKVTAVQLFNDFAANETAAQKKYVPIKVGDKTLQVTGAIREIGRNEGGEVFYTLKTTDEMFGVKCIMEIGEEVNDVKEGDNITVRGFCDGYNMDVIVNRCKVVK